VSRVNKDDVASAARGRWREILLSVCRGLSPESLNGSHEKSCPKCGGNTRFRAFDDFDETGGLYCSHCHAAKNGDGFAAVQWWQNCDFSQALQIVADFLKLAPSNLAGSPRPADSGSRNPLPPQQIEWSAKWTRWQIGGGQLDYLLSQWCDVKRPIVPQSLLAAGVMVGQWPKQNRDQCVLGFHGFGADESHPNSLLLYRSDGAMFPAFGKLDQRKTHLVGGSKAGWIHCGGIQRTRAAEVVWRVEGLPDALSLLPLLPSTHAIETPACGCGWNANSLGKNPPLGIFAGKVVVGVGDADAPGQRGLWRWAADVVDVAAKLFLAELPFEIVESHGMDLRDWIAAGADFAAVQKSLKDYRRSIELLEECLSSPDLQTVEPLRNYDLYGKRVLPLAIGDIQSQLWAMTERWPRRVGSRLFAHEGERISWINNKSALCSWFGLRTGSVVDFLDVASTYSKAELYEGLQQSSVEYKAVENVPHEPQIDGHYYACGDFPDGDGEHLTWLLDRFCVDDRADRDLILLLMATVFWGGAGGSRPAFMITANGTGAGKTTLASVVAELAGGLISVGQRDSMRDITERMLTADGRDKRVLLIDNIKATRFSSAEIEQLVTAPVISGRELYRGESQRPNTLTWVMTMNGVGVAKDIADRVVVIRLLRPEYSGNWTDETMGFVRQYRREIICDLLTFLRGPKDDLEKATRWGSWGKEVLARLSLPEDAAALIHNRQREIDVDGDEAGMVQDYFRDRLLDLRYMPSLHRVFIPSKIANQWHAAATNERPSVTKTTQWMKTQIEQGAIARLALFRNMTCRGFVWSGEQADLTGEVRMDLEDEHERDEFTKSH
jgi:predicted kinase